MINLTLRAGDVRGGRIKMNGISGELSPFFQSVIEQDEAAVVICDLEHTIIYMNPVAVSRYEKRGGSSLVGTSLLDCHNGKSRELIQRIVCWFAESGENNKIYTFHNDKENKDVYMVALRDPEGELIGYYEKHEYRNVETEPRYCF